MACMQRVNALLVALAALLIGQLRAECEEGTVKLVDGPTAHCGRVEVCHENVWGTICDDKWDYRDCTVVCKQLGYERYERRFLRAYFGEGTGPIWLDNMRCSSAYDHILQCDRSDWGRHNCEHDEDAGVCCERVQAPKPLSLPVRLTCPPCSESCQECQEKLHPETSDEILQPTVSGIVEVEVDGVWGPISAEYWTVKEASVVCGQLGYPFSKNITNEDIWPEGDVVGSGASGDDSLCEEVSSSELEQLNDSFNATFLKELECSGKETELLGCFFSGIGNLPNPSVTNRVAAVQCGVKPPNENVRYQRVGRLSM